MQTWWVTRQVAMGETWYWDLDGYIDAYIHTYIHIICTYKHSSKPLGLATLVSNNPPVVVFKTILVLKPSVAQVSRLYEYVYVYIYIHMYVDCTRFTSSKLVPKHDLQTQHSDTLVFNKDKFNTCDKCLGVFYIFLLWMHTSSTNVSYWASPEIFDISLPETVSESVCEFLCLSVSIGQTVWLPVYLSVYLIHVGVGIHVHAAYV